MRQLRDGKVENFPPQSELRCVMVEHSLQGENTSLSVIDFIASGRVSVPVHDLILTICLQIKLSLIYPGRRSGTNSSRLVSMTTVKLRLSVVCQEDGR